MAKRRPCRKCGRNRDERFFTSAKGRTCATCRKRATSTASRGVRLRERYGLSLDEYERLLDHQDGKCAICERTPRYNLDVDHCHKTGAVRGLLCKVCNRRLLPSARDDVWTLRRAAFYLMMPPSVMAFDRIVFVPAMETHESPATGAHQRDYGRAIPGSVT